MPNELFEYLTEHYGRCEAKVCQCLRDGWRGSSCHNWRGVHAQNWQELIKIAKGFYNDLS